jgi:hypothetical protein
MRCNPIALLRGSGAGLMGATRNGREGAMPMPVSQLGPLWHSAF